MYIYIYICMYVCIDLPASVNTGSASALPPSAPAAVSAVGSNAPATELATASLQNRTPPEAVPVTP